MDNSNYQLQGFYRPNGSSYKDKCGMVLHSHCNEKNLRSLIQIDSKVERESNIKTYLQNTIMLAKNVLEKASTSQFVNKLGKPLDKTVFKNEIYLLAKDLGQVYQCFSKPDNEVSPDNHLNLAKKEALLEEIRKISIEMLTISSSDSMLFLLTFQQNFLNRFN